MNDVKVARMAALRAKETTDTITPAETIELAKLVAEEKAEAK